MIPLDALATERKIGMNCAVTVNYHDLSVRSAEEIAAANFIVEKTVTIYVVENSEKPQLKNLSGFFWNLNYWSLVFLVACFIPLKSNRSVKISSISTDIYFEDVFFGYPKRKQVEKQAVHT